MSAKHFRKNGTTEFPNSRERLLRAATVEFARQALRGARVDVIARRAKISKQLIYHHFGSNVSLYVAVLEHAYADIRAKERALNLSGDDPVTAMTKSAGFTFGFVSNNREFVRPRIDEKLLEGKFIRRPSLIKQTRSPLLRLLRETMQRGVAAGRFRSGVDPIQLYISMAGLCFFYIGNIYTLSALLERDLQQTSALRQRRSQVVEVVLGYLAARWRNASRGPGLRRHAAAPPPLLV